MHDIHAPAFCRAHRYRRWTSMEGTRLAPPHARPQRQAIESVESSHSLAIHRPPLPSEQHPDTQIPKPRSGMGPISNA